MFFLSRFSMKSMQQHPSKAQRVEKKRNEDLDRCTIRICHFEPLGMTFAFHDIFAFQVKQVTFHDIFGQLGAEE